jgi:hypothetical protein
MNVIGIYMIDLHVNAFRLDVSTSAVTSGLKAGVNESAAALVPSGPSGGCLYVNRPYQLSFHVAAC